MWFGTDKGVSRYTGLTPGAAARQAWTTFTTADGLAHNSVRSIAIGPDGTPWFGTWGGGVSHLADPKARPGDRTAWTTYVTDDVLIGNSIQSISTAPEDTLWFGTWGGGVSRLVYSAGAVPTGTGGRWTTYTTADSLVSNFVYATAVAPDGTLWVGTEGGVSRFGGQDWTTYTPADGLADSNVLAVAVAPNGTVWLGTWGRGVSRSADPGPGGTVPAGDVSGWTTYTVDDGLVDNRVQSIAVAPDGTVWFGTWGGISCLRGSDWTTYTTADGLADDRVNVLALAPDGTLWAGTEGGVSLFADVAGSRGNGRTWTTYTTTDGLANDSVTAIAATDDGTLWFGTHVGVSRFARYAYAAQSVHQASNTGTGASAWTTFTVEEGLPDDHIPSIAVASDGVLWFGSWHGGVARYQPPR
jgi:ligand-binding sensor domain-containing protein